MTISMTPSDLIALAKSRAAAANISAPLACAVAEQESSWNPWAIRYEPAFFDRYIVPLKLADATEANARSISWGLMQIMGETAREEGYKGALPALCDPQTGLDCGIEHLRRQLIRSAGNIPMALEFYNGGSNPAYASEVMARMTKYESPASPVDSA